jgi:hypothetical protein
VRGHHQQDGQRAQALDIRPIAEFVIFLHGYLLLVGPRSWALGRLLGHRFLRRVPSGHAVYPGWSAGGRRAPFKKHPLHLRARQTGPCQSSSMRLGGKLSQLWQPGHCQK